MSRTASNRIRIVTADKNTLILQGLKSVLGSDKRYELVAQVQTGGHFLDVCDALDFEIGIIGWELPDMSGQRVLEAVSERSGHKRLIVYTGASGAEVIRRVMKHGGYGFCCKTEPIDRLVDTVNAVANGRMCFPFIDVKSLYVDPLGQLTARERELLAALADGWTNHQIANRFGISQNTVKFHLKNLYDKLEIKNRAMAAALYASRVGSG